MDGSTCLKTRLFYLVVVAVLLALVAIGDCQFLTPDQLREQHDLGYGARTHYEMSGSRRTDMFDRVNPDYLLRGTIFFRSTPVLLLHIFRFFPVLVDRTRWSRVDLLDNSNRGIDRLFLGLSSTDP